MTIEREPRATQIKAPLSKGNFVAALFLWQKIGPKLFNLYHDRLDPNRLMRPTARRSGDTVYIGSCQSLQLLKLLVQHCIEPGIVDNQLTQDLVQDQGSILEAGEVLYNTSVDCQ